MKKYVFALNLFDFIFTILVYEFVYKFKLI